MTPNDDWFLYRNGQKSGPFPFFILQQMAGEGRVSQADTVWLHGMPHGARVRDVKELMEVVRGLQESNNRADDRAADNYGKTASLFGWLSLFILGMIFGPIAIGYGIAANSRGSNEGTTGIVCGSVGLVFHVLLTIVLWGLMANNWN
jgi:hypothetical protein